MVRRTRAPTIPVPKPPIDVEEAARLLAQGLTYTAIGAKLGYRPSSIRRRLLEYGVRPNRERSLRREKWGPKLYWAWKKMRRHAREQDTNTSEKWASFNAFYEWAHSARYRPGLVLARKHEGKAFMPSNCRWVPKKRTPGESSTRRPPKKLTERQWRRAECLHVDDGLSCAAVARKLGVANGTIIRGLQLRGCYRPLPPKLSGTKTGRMLYRAWSGMRSRCSDPHDPAYVYYGAKAARVSREWDEFEPFYKWALEAGWKPQLCLTRVGRARIFSSKNCRWVTRAEAARNAHHPNSKMPPQWTVTAFGETKGPTEWSRDRRCAVTLTGLLQRLRSGWRPERAIVSPSQTGSGPPPRRFVTAFRETKGVTEWAKDKRCKVTLVTLLRRLDQGILPEEAIRARPYHVR